MTIKSLILLLSADKVLGAAGGGLAAASLGFGVYMNIHGPVASFGHSKDFTVFAQMVGRQSPLTDTIQTMASPIADKPLDMTTTGTIPASPGAGGKATKPQIASGIISSVIVQAANEESATVMIDGEVRVVHVGDTVPSAGEVLEIWPGLRPAIKTSRGFIVSAHQ